VVLTKNCVPRTSSGSYLDGFARLNAHHHILRVSVFFAEYGCVGGDHGQRQSLSLTEGGRNDAVFLFSPWSWISRRNFFAEEVRYEAAACRACVRSFSIRRSYFAFKTPGKANSLGVLARKLLADARLVVKTMQRGFGLILTRLR